MGLTFLVVKLHEIYVMPQGQDGLLTRSNNQICPLVNKRMSSAAKMGLGRTPF